MTQRRTGIAIAVGTLATLALAPVAQGKTIRCGNDGANYVAGITAIDVKAVKDVVRGG